MVSWRRIPFSWSAVRRIAVRTLLVAVALLALLLGSFFLQPTRELWLQQGLDLALDSVPGQVQGQWSWPRLNRLEGRALIWTVPNPTGGPADTLAIVPSLALEIDLQGLRDHQLRVHELQVEANLLNVPRIQEQFSAAGPEPDSTSSTAGAVPFLREGSVPGLPSVGLDLFSFQVARLELPNELSARRLAMAGSLSLISGEQPHLLVQNLAGAAASTLPPRWDVELANLTTAAAFDPVSSTVTLDSLAATIPAASFTADSLLVEAGPVDLDGRGSWNPDTWNLTAGLRFFTRVPESLQGAVPGVVVREFNGGLDLSAQGTRQDLELTAALDMDPSADVRRGRMRGSLQATLDPVPTIRQAQLDTLDFQWGQTELTAGGRWDGENLEARARFNLPNLDLINLLAPGRLPGVTGGARAQLEVSGDPAQPHLTAQVTATGQVASIWALPGADEAAAQLPETIDRNRFAQVNLDLSAELDGSPDDLRVTLRTDLGQTPWLDQGLLVGKVQVFPRARSLGTVQLDTLAVSLLGSGVMATGTLDTTRADLTADLTMSGTGLLDLVAPGALPEADLGFTAHLAAQGPWQQLSGEGSMAGHLVTADLDLPDFQAQVTATATTLEAVAEARGAVRLATVDLDSVRCRWEGSLDAASGLPPGRFSIRAWAPQASAWLAGSASGDSVRTATVDTFIFTAAGQTASSAAPFTLTQGPGPRDLALDSLRLQGDLGTLQAAGRFNQAGLAASAATNLLLTREWLDVMVPSPLWSAGKGVDLAVEGDIELATTGNEPGAGPLFRGHSALQLIPRSEEPPARLDVGFRLASGDTSALLADLQLAVGQASLVTGSMQWPGRVDPVTGHWLPAEDTPGGIQVPEQELPLAFINRFLPPEVSLNGQLIVGAGLDVGRRDSLATGSAVGEGRLSGLAQARGLTVNLPNRSRAELEADLNLEGRLVDPRLTGTITVTSGLFRLPEAPRALHPTSGTSVLWTAARRAEADSGSTAAAVGSQWLVGETLEPATPPYIPDLDLKIVLPGNFQVTGYGLETELAGDVKVTRGWDEQGNPVPVLNGRIRVVEGTLRALNQVFEVERGEIDLEGRIPVDPVVNLVLVTEVDGTTVRVKVTGTALQPKVDLESDPAMIQSDIMAFLLFGRPINELDADQSGSLGSQQTPAQQLRQNLQGLALVFGAAGIQNRMSGKIGVDQVQIGSDTAGGSTLVLGKYLNPRLLLKYHQSLERSGTYFMTLEYSMSRLFKLISTYGQGEEASGLELRAQKRY